MKEGSFNLRKFCSNSMLLQTTIDKSEPSNSLPIPLTLDLVEADESYASATLGTTHGQFPDEHWAFDGTPFKMSL